MESKRSLLAELREVPAGSLTLLAGPPGAGKSDFCHQMAIESIAADRPVIFVTTDRTVDDTVSLLRDEGLEQPVPGVLTFVDAFADTVGLATVQRPDAVGANCEDLNSINMAIAKVRERVAGRGVLLAFDSLTSPYLFNRGEIFRFMKLSLARFAAEGNLVVAVVDEGCGSEEDLTAMMSLADAVFSIRTRDDKQLIDIIKHPRRKPARIEIGLGSRPTIEATFDAFRSRIRFEPSLMKRFMKSLSGEDPAALRPETGDFVNLFWPNFAHWSSMLWDPQRFPGMIYELNKEDGAFSTETSQFLPWRERLSVSLVPFLRSLGLFPKTWTEVKDMQRIKPGPWGIAAEWERSGLMEYLDQASNTDEHHFRVYENSDCWGFENVGTAMAWHLPPHMAGWLRGFEQDGRDWNAIETKCIGLGDPYCEFRLVPRESGELRDSLEKDSAVVERIHARLMDRLVAFLLQGEPLVNRPRLGSDVHLHLVSHGFGFPYLALAGERYRMAMRMGGARAGKKVGERLLDAALGADEALKRVVRFLDHCRVGKITAGETIRITENCETSSTVVLTTTEEPSCYFTTGFLNGLFSAVKKQRVRETRCIGLGDPYCEWEIT
jgi:predicted hydrocarbon binding protein/KaiC/GvpD/RAD55 family RecA-like ATPase